MLRSSACMQFDNRIFKKLKKSDSHLSDTDFYYEVDKKVCANTDQFANTSFEAEEVECCSHLCTYKNGLQFKFISRRFSSLNARSSF